MIFTKGTAAVLVSLASVALPQTTTLNSLARDIERVESVREVKDVLRSFAQLAQFGKWSNMAALFSNNGTLQWGNDTTIGLEAIETWLRADAGSMSGMQPGSLNTVVTECPLVTLSIDGLTAKARYNGLRFQGDGIGGTRIQGGIYENEYIFTNGSWKISLLHYYPLYAGPYIGGWRNVGGNLSIVPYHFTPDEAGIPIPPPAGDSPNTTLSISQLAQRVARLNDEDAVRNLQNGYGYYVDRRMWPDVVDLFISNTSTSISSVTISGVGTFTGSAGVLTAMQRMGPENLTQGILNEHLILDTVVSIHPNGLKATARGIEIGMIGDANTRAASWEFNVFRNDFVKDEDGIWKFEELNITPLIVANYSTGWGNGLIGPLPTEVPQFLNVSGRSSRFVDGTGTGVNSDQLGAIHAANGHKEVPFTGFFLTSDRIAGACHAEYGYPNMSTLRANISFHWLMQPVILVADDGRSSSLRARLLQPSTSQKEAGTFEGGMYSNQFALENVTWKIWSTGIDEFYWQSKNWATGWSGMNRRNESKIIKSSKLSTDYPPDLSLKELGSPREDGFMGGSGRYVEWPEIPRMWWPYRNLVSGRIPESYWPGCVPCKFKEVWNLTSNGYLEPPTGP
ncbi:hypothetical protein EG329_006379 [Mollisiaceae sp. DMI_Dod_QoI]|nr:hypothetical protein EG329_006379 [Helotiales sp. DMI_Dod_QoI]